MRETKERLQELVIRLECALSALELISWDTNGQAPTRNTNALEGVELLFRFLLEDLAQEVEALPEGGK